MGNRRVTTRGDFYRRPPLGDTAVTIALMQDPDRLTVIEEKLAYLEKYVGDLDEVVRDLAGQLAKQGEGVTAVRKMLEDHLNDPGDSNSDRDLIDDKPPHW